MKALVCKQEKAVLVNEILFWQYRYPSLPRKLSRTINEYRGRRKAPTMTGRDGHGTRRQFPGGFRVRGGKWAFFDLPADTEIQQYSFFHVFGINSGQFSPLGPLRPLPQVSVLGGVITGHKYCAQKLEKMQIFFHHKYEK